MLFNKFLYRIYLCGEQFVHTLVSMVKDVRYGCALNQGCRPRLQKTWSDCLAAAGENVLYGIAWARQYSRQFLSLHSSASVQSVWWWNTSISLVLGVVYCLSVHTFYFYAWLLFFALKGNQYIGSDLSDYNVSPSIGVANVLLGWRGEGVGRG